MNHLGANLHDCKAAGLNSLLPYVSNGLPFPYNAALAAYPPAQAADLQRVLMQSLLDKQANDGASLSNSLFNQLYSAYFNALLKQFAEYYSNLLQSQPDSESKAEPDKSAPAELTSKSPPISPPLSPRNDSQSDPDALDADSASKKTLRSAAFNDFQDGITVGYTYDAFFVTDGRSRKRKQPPAAASASAPAAPDNSAAATVATAAVEEHSVTHKRQLRYVCNECGKNYATSSNLSRHKQTHRSLNSKSAKKCPHCDKVYVSMPALSMHILTHDLKHKCDVCGKAFSRLWLLNGHKRIHSKEKPYGCAHCGKAFADRSNLRAHIQTHSQFKLYKCDFCGKSFALKSYLNKHYESSTCCAAALNGNSQNTCTNELLGSDRSETGTVCASEIASAALNTDTLASTQS